MTEAVKLTRVSPERELRHFPCQAPEAVRSVAPSTRSSSDIDMMWMCQARPHAEDEGYESLLDAPPSLEQRRAYFTALRDQIQMLASREGMSFSTKMRGEER